MSRPMFALRFTTQLPGHPNLPYRSFFGGNRRDS